MPQPAPTPDHKPSSAQKQRRKTTCRGNRGTRNCDTKSQSTPTPRNKAYTLSEKCSQQYGISDAGESAGTSRSQCRSRKDIDYHTLNDGLEDDIAGSPKHTK